MNDLRTCGPECRRFIPGFDREYFCAQEILGEEPLYFVREGYTCRYNLKVVISQPVCQDNLTSRLNSSNPQHQTP